MDIKQFTCRTCLRNFDEVSTNDQDDLQLQFETCIPELTLGIVKDYVFCRECIELLFAAYSFKRMCLETEERIYNYILYSSCEDKSVDIEAVVAWNVNKQVLTNGPVESSTNGGEEFVNATDDLLEIHKHEVDEDYECSNLEEDPSVDSGYDKLCDIEKEFGNYSIDEFYAKRLIQLPECFVLLNRLPQNVMDKYTTNRVHKKPECKRCAMVFETRASKQKHYRIAHKNKYKCKECNFTTKTKAAFIVHSETHSVYQKRYRCSKCSFFTIHEDVLFHHMKLHTAVYDNRRVDYSMLKCIECNYRSHSKHELEGHYLKWHYFERPFSCNLCKADFTLRAHLISHIIAHSVLYLDIQIEHSYAVI